MLYQNCMILKQLYYLAYYKSGSANLEYVIIYYSFEIKHLVLNNNLKNNHLLNQVSAAFFDNIYPIAKHTKNIIPI